jgi:hypothetical protein
MIKLKSMGAQGFSRLSHRNEASGVRQDRRRFLPGEFESLLSPMTSPPPKRFLDFAAPFAKNPTRAP